MQAHLLLYILPGAIRGRAIQRISRKRMADRRHVDPDLVGPAVFDPAGEQRAGSAVRPLSAREYLVEGPRRFSVLRADHKVGSWSLSADRAVDYSLRNGKISFRQRQVGLDEPSVLPLPLDHRRRFRIPGKSHNARSLSVQPAGHPHVHRCACSSQMRRGLVSQGVAVVSGRRMADHSGGFIDDQKIVVLIQDL